jgi:hypothetical protein
MYDSNEKGNAMPVKSELDSFLGNFDQRVSELSDIVNALGQKVSRLKPLQETPKNPEEARPGSGATGLVGDCLVILGRLTDVTSRLQTINNHLSKII